MDDDNQTVTVLSPGGVAKVVKLSDLKKLPGYEKVVEFYELPGELLDQPARHVDPTEDADVAERDYVDQIVPEAEKPLVEQAKKIRAAQNR
jgi:hypothetical protein